MTHAQLDHEGGAAEILHAFPVGLVVDGRDGARSPGADGVGAAAAREHVRRVLPDPGVVVRAGRLELRVLWPPREPAAAHAGEDPNRRAIVAIAQLGRLRVFLPADAESDVTSALDLPAVDVLKVAHHGSADPGLESLLARLRPRIAVIEVGPRNPYGHPAPPTLAALRVVPHVYRTDRDGTVRVTPSGAGLRVSAEG